MEMKPITLCGVPALAWGKDSDRRILAVHGMMSHKADEPIRLLAEAAEKQGIQTVSIDTCPVMATAKGRWHSAPPSTVCRNCMRCWNPCWQRAGKWDCSASAWAPASA